MPLTPRWIAFHKSLKRLSWSLCGVVALSALSSRSEAQTTQTWLNGGGSNEWSTSAPNWDAGVVWTNGNNAIFGGATEVVDILGLVEVNSILFNSNGTSGWTIADINASSALTLVGEGRITTATGSHNTIGATIAGNLAGGNLVKAGDTILVLSGANTYTGSTTVEKGTLQIDYSGALGATSGVTVNGPVSPSPNGGSLALNDVMVSGISITINGGGSGDNSGALKASGLGTSVWTGNVTIGSANTRVGATQATGVLEIAGAIDSGGAAHGLVVRAHNDGGTVLLSNANNTYLGATTVVAGVLKVGVDDALPTGTVVNLGNAQTQGKAALDLNGFNQTVAGVTSVLNNNVEAKVTNTSDTASVLTVSNSTTVTTGNAFITGNLSLVKEGTGIFQLTSANTYTGSTTVNTGTLEISGLLGTVSSTEFILNGGTLSINNTATGTNNTDRINDAANITFRDGDLVFTGSVDAGVNSSETVGNFILDRGYQTVRVSYGGTNVSTLTASGFTRSAGGGVAFVTGANLGANSTSTASISRFFVTNAPTLIGTTDALNTGVNAAAKNTKIVPYLVGSSTGSATPDTFVTYNAETGFRPLDPVNEFTQNAIVTGDNIRITGNLTMGTGTSTAINSLIIVDPTSSSATNTTLSLNGQTLTVTSGAILFDSNTGTITGGTLNLGAQETIIYANGGISTISSRIRGSGGLTVAGTGIFVLNNASNDYTGDTTLLSGTTVVGANSAGSPGAVTQGPLGRGNLVFAGGAIRSSQGNASIVGNNIIFKADTTIPSSGTHLTFTGSVTLAEGDRTLTQSTPSNTTFSGAIGDGGQNHGITVAGTSTGAVIFSGTNTYTGATNVTGTATLLMNGTHNTGSSYRVASGATLGGGGTIGIASGGSMTIAGGGTLSVGDGTANAAAFSITTSNGGALILTDNTSILRLDIVSDASLGVGSDQAGDGSRADRLVVSGATQLNGARLVIGTAGVDSTTFSEGDRWKIFDWVTALPTGAFTINPVTDLPVLGAGLRWDYSDLYTGGTISVVVVPEPSRAMLLMIGAMIGLFQRRRRRR